MYNNRSEYLYIVFPSPYNMDVSNMSTKEIIDKVESGELPSCTYNSFAEFVRAMET